MLSDRLRQASPDDLLQKLYHFLMMRSCCLGKTSSGRLLDTRRYINSYRMIECPNYQGCEPPPVRTTTESAVHYLRAMPGGTAECGGVYLRAEGSAPEILRTVMPLWTPDPTFYPSPKMAAEAPAEKLAFVSKSTLTGP